MLTFLNCHPGALSLPRHLFKEACQKSPSKKVPFEFHEPDEGEDKVIFMICYQRERGSQEEEGQE